ncbi:MAG: biopolymer transporter ExbD [Lentisphaeria bacterium]|nr:biopolymer transporter ExbD [Lentisphaeria bacterium]
MFESVRQYGETEDTSVAVDIAPLIDIVFILLIFFLTTTTLLKDQGIPVNQPAAGSSVNLRTSQLRIVLTGSGQRFIDGSFVDEAGCKAAVERFLRSVPEGSVIIVPDQDTAARHLVDVLDIARQAGAERLAIATRPEQDRINF